MSSEPTTTETKPGITTAQVLVAAEFQALQALLVASNDIALLSSGAPKSNTLNRLATAASILESASAAVLNLGNVRKMLTSNSSIGA